MPRSPGIAARARGRRNRRLKNRRLRKRADVAQQLLWQLGEGLLRTRVQLVGQGECDVMVRTHIRKVTLYWDLFVEHIQPNRDDLASYNGNEQMLYNIIWKLKEIKKICLDSGYRLTPDGP